LVSPDRQFGKNPHSNYVETKAKRVVWGKIVAIMAYAWSKSTGPETVLPQFSHCSGVLDITR
jgi:hypothetical protein